MLRSVILFVALLLCLTYVSADTCSTGQTAVSTSGSSGVGTATKLVFANNLAFTPDVQYVITSGSDLGYTVTGCVDTATAKQLGLQVTKTADTITITAALGSTTTTTSPSGTTTTTASPGGKTVSNSNSGSKSGVAPLTTFLALAFGLLFVIRPKSVSSVVLLVALLGVAVYTHADNGTNTIVIKVSVPDQITQFCNGNSCQSKDAGDVSKYVNVFNDRYATMDLGTSCDTSAVLYLPENWRIASTSDDTAALAIAFNSWSTSAIILADGSAYANGQNMVSVGSNYFTTVNNGGKTGYQVTTCDSKILIVQRFPLANSKPNIVSTLSVLPSVTFNGYDYATADNVDYFTTKTGPQSGGIWINSTDAWQVAPDDDSTAVALATYTKFFGAAAVVVAGGNAYNNTFGLFASLQLTTVSYNGGNVYGVNASFADLRIVIRRVSSGTTATWNSTTTPLYTYITAGNEFAVIDSADPLNKTETDCQARFYAIPSGYTLVAADLLYQYRLSLSGQQYNIWTTTDVVVGATSAQINQAGADATGVQLLKRTVGTTDYYFTSSCARVIVSRAYAAKTSFTVDMKLLVVASINHVNATDNAELSLIQVMMMATGIPYDLMTLADNTTYCNLIYPGSLPLLDAQGNPKYYGIVMTTSNPTYETNIICTQSGNKNTDSILKAPQLAQIQQYQYQYNIRVVALNGNPIDWTGLTGDGRNYGNVTTVSMSWDATFVSNHNSGAKNLFSGLQTGNTVSYDMTNQYFYALDQPTTSTIYTVENMLTASSTVGFPGVTKVLAGIVTPKSGPQYEIMQFWTGMASFLDYGPILANVWITWVTRGIWLGNRRIYLSPQIDDFFLSTGQYGQPDDVQHSVRINSTDVERTVTFLNQLNTTLPSGSHVTLAMAVNCAEADSAESDSGLITVAQKYVDFFWWESHTWSHLDFTHNPEESCDYAAADPKPSVTPDPSLAYCHNTTYDEALTELVLNNNYTKIKLFPTHGLQTPTWSENSMITPAITGLFNPMALRALYDAGMTCVVGDNTIPALVPANPYLGWNTTVEVNGFDKIFVIPRYATNIYFNSATPQINMQQYNDRYGPQHLSQFPGYYSYNSTLDQLLDREAETVFRQLAFFRHDPYMFHQCNLYHFGYKYAKDSEAKPWSLVTLWLQAVMDKYVTLLNFPLKGVKQQDLRDVYFARIKREGCGISGKLSVSGTNTQSVQLSTTGQCEAALTAPTTCGTLDASQCRSESYAADTTIWAQMQAGTPTSVPVTTPWAAPTKAK